MKIHTSIIKKDLKLRSQKGFSLPEVVVVLLVIAILLVLAMPQIISSRRLFRFSGFQRQIATSLREARQEAMSQRKPVTFRYDNTSKYIISYGGDFGALGDAKNVVVPLTGSGVELDDLKYGRPTGPTGVPTSALSDTTNITSLTSNAVEITFQPDGSVIDASNNPQNQALFFYHDKYRLDTAFAVSILGAGGRIKVWRYSRGVNSYVE
jgi:prepilin-type N-terminal cleavage/methylation domain-containing protein